MTPRRALSLCLAALAFTLPLSIAGTNVALAATSACLLWCLASPSVRPAVIAALGSAVRGPVFLALAAYAAWGLISSLVGYDPTASLRLFPKDAHKLWAFLAIAAALAASERVIVSAPFAAGLAAHASFGVVQAVLQWMDGAERVRARGFLHPVAYGEVLGLGLIGAAAWLARPQKGAPRRERSAATALAALAAAALVLSQTRAVLLALGAAFGTACLVEARWRRHAWAALLVLAGVVAFWEVMPTGGRNLSNLLSQSAGTSAHRTRLVLWDVALRVFADRPLAGVGPGQYRLAFERHHPQRLDGVRSWGNAHNLYLHQLAERGALGLLFLLAALAALLRGAWRAETDRSDAWSLWAAAATAAFLVMNLTEIAWQTEQVATLFLFIWLLGAGTRPEREIL